MQGCALHMRKKAFIRFIGLNLKLKFSLAPRLHRVYAPGRGSSVPPTLCNLDPPGINNLTKSAAQCNSESVRQNAGYGQCEAAFS